MMQWIALLILSLILPIVSARIASADGSSDGQRNGRPNIVFIMADDLGWNDVSWHNGRMTTPNIHHLATHHAALLNQSYVNKLCSPTRSAMLSGYYPFRIGTQTNVFQPMEPTGVPTKFKFYPESLQKLGYSTYLVGKWHLGYCNSSYLPQSRGFDYFSGYYLGAEEYYTHSIKWTSEGCDTNGYDFWKQNDPNFADNGTYSSYVFSRQVDSILESHDKEKPFFLYYAFQSVHCPLEVPETFRNVCRQEREARNKYCGMVNALDTAVGLLVARLKSLNLYNNTTIIFSTDNGGQVYEGGNNYPLRGNKDTIWEGGTRAISFFHSPSLVRRTGVRTSLFHIVDWYSTILTLAGKPTPFHGDGMDQLNMLMHGDRFGRRRFLVYGIDTVGSAIRRGKFKLIRGDAGKPDGWIPPEVDAEVWDASNSTVRPDKLLLFNLETDPTEHIDLSKKKPRVVQSMLRTLKKLHTEMVPSIHRHCDARGDPKHFNGTYASGWC